MKRTVISSGLGVLAALLLAGCVQNVGGGTGGDGGAGAQGGSAPGGSDPGGSDQGGGGGQTTTTTTGTGGGGPCMSGPNDDADGDGFTPAQGDCNDCAAGISPNAIEVPTLPGQTPADENCDGQVDEALQACDGGLLLDDADPVSAAKAVDICKTSSGPGDWGLVSAQWVLSDGTAAPNTPEYHLGHGILGDFGPNVGTQLGQNMLALSSGAARRPMDPGYVDTNYAKNITSGQPMGFPKPAPACPGVIAGAAYDSAALEVTLQTPSNAAGLAFDFTFYTHEFPSFVCSVFNDLFVAMLSPIPAGQTDGNISFDGMGNTISVNSAFLEVCGCSGGPPCMAGGQVYTCSLGTAQLLGNGFDAGGSATPGAATGWLSTTAPVPANSTVTLRFAIHDSGDGILDSTTLVDRFRWIGSGVPIVQTMPAE